MFYDVTSAPYNAAGDGSTDDTSAIQDAIDDASGAGGTVYFPAGRYHITDTLVIPGNTGVMLVGDGFVIGQGVVNNVGSFIEYAPDAGPAISLGPATPANATAIGVHIKDLAIQAINPDYTRNHEEEPDPDTNPERNLVEIRRAGKCRFENVGFLGLEDAEGPAADALVFGNEWVDLQFLRCWFRTAYTGVKKGPLIAPPASPPQEWQDYVVLVVFEGCEFGRCDTSIDIQGTVQSVTVDRSTFEPAVSGDTAPVVIVGNACGVYRSWCGDSNGSGTWLSLGGVGGRAEHNFIGFAEVGIEVTTGSFAWSVESNVISDCATGVLVNASANTRISENQIALQNGTLGVEVNSDTSCLISNNGIYPSGTTTTGYRLNAGSAGVLNQLRSASPSTEVDDQSGGAWTIVNHYDTTFASAVSGFSPSRFANVKSATDQATAESDGRLNFNYVIGRYGVESQGYFALVGTGSGNPAANTRFIGGASTTTDMYINAPSRIRLDLNGTGALELSLTSTNDDTAAVLLVRQGGAWTAKRVYQGATNSAGTGRRRLEVDN